MAVKAPTSVLFSPDGTFKAFGFEAEEFFSDDTKEDRDQYYFFKNFKMILYKDKEISRHTQLKDISGVKSLPAIDVFSSVIKYFCSLLMDKIMLQFSEGGKIEADDIFWVLTVPAIWGLKAKCFMREAAEMAGIKSNQLALALEPEAASLACRQIPTTVVTKDSGKKVVGTFKEGSRYLVLDLGGGTIDLTAHEIIERGGLKEIHQASGGNWGGTSVNQKFIEFLAKLLGDGAIERIRRNEPADWLEVIDNFEQKKCTYNFNGNENISLRVPVSVSEVLKTKQPLTGPNVYFKRDKLTIAPELFMSFFEESLEMICKSVRDTLDSLSGVQSILIVGGFADCNLVIQKLRSEFENYTVLVPEEPRLAVLKGAVMHGMDPYTIRTRVCRYTYGIPTQRRFREWQDPEEKKRAEPDGKIYCDDIFEKHVERGETIVMGKYKEAKEYCTVRKDQKMVALELYASSDANPTFVTDESCYHIGMVEINLENNVNDGRVLVSLNVGGTEIEIQAKEYATGKVSTALCNFLG
ncbi:hypothetical protein FSP39_006557 [Pinctada imbricata]|uniref:Heat shock 70 kDa protein 12A n=1 Tax=Pinctada imbricata TaxID=66713 RepID=A0AA88YDW2_PINIB|nr:hypothetical protein FSP39_006557 [Pinctada imbricata]